MLPYDIGRPWAIAADADAALAGLQLRRFSIGLGLVAVLVVPLVGEPRAGFGEDPDDVELLFDGGRGSRPAATGIHDRDVERRRPVLVPAGIVRAVSEQ